MDVGAGSAGSADARPLPPGDALEKLCFSDAVFSQRYEGWRVLGRGPWATVIRTRSRDLRHDIALKVFVNLDPELLDRVRQEVHAVQALATPYLVHTYSLFDRGTIAWFEMELVEGPNLQQELERLFGAGEHLSLPSAYEIALAAGRCVWHAHRRGVLHRDIKPANVLLPGSGSPAAKVSDFGIARLAGVPGPTPPGTITGTPRFASPEALAGQPVGPPHDVYGLAATLYTLFAGGSPPYEIPANTSIAALRRVQMGERPKALRARGFDVDRDVERALMQALAFNATERPTAGQLVLRLERARSRRLGTHFPDGPGRRATVASWRIGAVAVGLTVMALWTRMTSDRKGGAHDDPHATVRRQGR